MMNKLPPFKGLNIRIPILIPIKGRGVINQGSGLVLALPLELGSIENPVKPIQNLFKTT